MMKASPVAPSPVRPGDTIGIMAPSSYVDMDDITRSQKRLESLGYKIHIHPQTSFRAGQMAGSNAQKIDALHELFIASDIQGIWFAGGGNRALDLLDDLDYSLIQNHPKAVLGFSDNTALLNALSARTGLITYHTEVFKHAHKSPFLEVILSALAQTPQSLPLSLAPREAIPSFKGRLIGGNLSVFHYLVGTKYCPPLEGSVLFLEDCGDELSRLDRMLIHLKRHGVFEQVSAILLGQFSNISDSGKPFAPSFTDVIQTYLPRAHFPLVTDLPFGHMGENFPIPINGLVQYESGQSLIRITCE